MDVSVTYENDIGAGGIRIYEYSIKILDGKQVFVIGNGTTEFAIIKQSMKNVAEESLVEGVELIFPIYKYDYNSTELKSDNNNTEWLILPYNIDSNSWFRGSNKCQASYGVKFTLSISYRNQKINFNIYKEHKIKKIYNKLELDQFIKALFYYQVEPTTCRDQIKSIKSEEEEYCIVEFSKSVERLNKVIMRNINVGMDVMIVSSTIYHGEILAVLPITQCE